MSKFLDLLKANGIRYDDTGPQVSKGNVYIQCPWCGPSDKKHMGIRIVDGFYGCWKDERHRGQNFAYLLSKLLRIPLETAQSMVSDGGPRGAQFDSFQSEIAAKVAGLGVPAAKSLDAAKPKTLGTPSDWLPVRNPYSRGAAAYLEARGIPEWAWDGFGLRTALTGLWAYRVIIPMRLRGTLVTWTGRTTQQGKLPRYLSCPTETALEGIKDIVWPFDYAKNRDGKRFLFVVEGPMDALKMNVLLRDTGDAAVCLSGKTISPQQMQQVLELAADYQCVFMLLDTDAMGSGMRMVCQLRLFTPCYFLAPGGGAKDPGELDAAGVAVLLTQAESLVRKMSSSASNWAIVGG